MRALIEYRPVRIHGTDIGQKRRVDGRKPFLWQIRHLGGLVLFFRLMLCKEFGEVVMVGQWWTWWTWKVAQGMEAVTSNMTVTSQTWSTLVG